MNAYSSYTQFSLRFIEFGNIDQSPHLSWCVRNAHIGTWAGTHWKRRHSWNCIHHGYYLAAGVPKVSFVFSGTVALDGWIWRPFAYFVFIFHIESYKLNSNKHLILHLALGGGDSAVMPLLWWDYSEGGQNMGQVVWILIKAKYIAVKISCKLPYSRAPANVTLKLKNRKEILGLALF